MAEKPCSWYVNTPKGPRYCEAGPAGHRGSHLGDRSKQEYLARYLEFIHPIRVEPKAIRKQVRLREFSG